MFARKQKKKQEPISPRARALRELIARDAAEAQDGPRQETRLRVYHDSRDHYLIAPIRCYGDPREIYLA